jgi:ATP-binding cassette subfamily B protein
MNTKPNYKNIARFTWHLWRQQKGSFPLLLIGMGLAAFIDTLFPVVTANLVREISLTPDDMRGWTVPIIKAFAFFILIDVFYHALRNGAVYVWINFALKNLYTILTESFSKVQKFSTDWHANAFAGGTVRKITRGMWAFDVFADNIFMFIYPTSIVMISMTTILFVKWPLIGLVTLLTSMLYIGFSVWAVIKVNEPLFRKASQGDTQVGAALADAITGNAAVKAFGAESAEDARFQTVASSWRSLASSSWHMSNAMDLIRRYLALLMMASMVGTSVYMWAHDQATAADVVFVLTSYLLMSAWMRNIGEQISNLLKAMAEMEDVVSFWMREDEITESKDAKDFVPGAGEIVFDKVRFAYANKDMPIYDDFSITIKPGEKVALVGHSGSGKSTFVKILQRLYDVQGGAIRIDGQDVRDLTQSSLRQGISLVPQEPILFHRSIAANIAYGKPNASMDEIVAAAKKAYAHDFIESLPLGYNTLVGERGIKLSGGERQRVAIARAILADSKILILDEATSSLDSVSEHYIQKALSGLMEGRTTITIAHRLATIKSVDRILVFEKGSIVEEGTHEGLIRNTGSHYKRLYDMQALDLVGEDEYATTE